MGLLDLFKKKKNEIDPEVLRENFVSARRQNQNFCQREYTDMDSMETIFTNTKKTELVKVGDMDAAGDRLMLCDPCYVGSNMVQPMERTTNPGKFPVFASIMTTQMTGRVVAGFKIKVSDESTVRYEIAMPVGVKAWQVDDPMVYPYISVETDVVCALDGKTELPFAAATNRYYNSHPGKDLIIDELQPLVEETGYAMWTIPGTEYRIPVFKAGLGQGMYNAFWGFDKDNHLTELVLPMVYPELFE